MPEKYQTSIDPDPNSLESKWGYTQSAQELAYERQMLEFQANKEPRKTIGNGTRIDKGVYEGKYGGEKIVVDSEKEPLISDAVDRVAAAIRRQDGTYDKSKALSTVYNLVCEEMQYDSDIVEGIFESYGRVDGRKIDLGVYIAAHAGVCRHQALYAGIIIEGLCDRGVLQGSVTVNRSMMPREGDRDDQYDGHAWVRYTNSAGQVIIIDPAQHRFDTLDNLMKLRRDNEEVWDYARDEDKAKYRGGAVLTELDHARGGGWQKHSNNRVEYDDDGLIIFPDEFHEKDNSLSHARNGETPASLTDEEISVKFWASIDNLRDSAKRALDQSGAIDPNVSAGKLSHSIETLLAELPVLPEQTIAYLQQVKAICDSMYKIGYSQKDVSSKQKAVLNQVYEMIRRIQ